VNSLNVEKRWSGSFVDLFVVGVTFTCRGCLRN
jgi:hypothetical protein